MAYYVSVSYTLLKRNYASSKHILYILSYIETFYLAAVIVKYAAHQRRTSNIWRSFEIVCEGR